MISVEEAKRLIEDAYQLPLEVLARRAPDFVDKVVNVGLEKIKNTDPEKAEGRRNFALSEDLSEERLSMPAEIQLPIYCMIKSRIVRDLKSAIINSVCSNIGFYVTSLLMKGDDNDLRTTIGSGVFGVSLYLGIKSWVYAARGLGKVYRQQWDERFSRPLNDREVRLVNYIFMDDTQSSGGQNE
ncbi:MAG: hypothetical protein A2904_02525 [Candidatus Staskawiczbacteria bacterium RIFCSPLOWO2_01_FULL_33_9]|uniref:Uncharacterized protein n=1 Tax=Candidatus Staskawiczbacteria bacterium RIFCSPLOWO2_01_FULL_33_9 TaxID=1802211 RepID=A0A1G2I811_9BACT|nr:MAG: hypothetical protein A2904_02525 [Candidatus Staskawiczbacteria bacterium RIFCSPLOWO2_01_FULL_33_9]